MRSRTYILIILSTLAVILLLGALYITFFNNNSTQKEVAEVFDAKAILSELNDTDQINDYLQIEQLIKNAMGTYGTKAGFLIIDEGERQGKISNDACHGLLHYVGHVAYGETPLDYDAILSVVEGTSCLGGYLHGVEAEIILQSSNVIQDVTSFCAYQKEKGVNPGPCFHGAGHAAAELYHYDVPKSLALCDSLRSEIENDLTNCYRGVFSEVGNVVVGYDGHTGLDVDPIAIEGLNPENPYDYCNTFEVAYRSSCKSQLLKVFTMDLPMREWLTVCTNPTFDKQSREICVNIISGVYVRSHLSFNETTSLPSIISDFSEETQKVAVLGSAEAFSGYADDNAPKDWKSFCNSFENVNVEDYCHQTFKEMELHDNAPWMERTDIR